ncbi:HEAT repeat domain-containing protein [Paucibacter sp. KBW04]|uniref:HEAT repeat domain-containing protein n=1 Tax=Paucibacter sp. KBW04 TaxID=2153361 RepID=UPI0018CC1CCA|nr:HEAT repeat domain-containing protein [Paucibacter sp. KBW04]
MSLLFRPLRIAALISLTVLVSACAPKSYLVKTPSPSGLNGTTANSVPAKLSVVDQRKGAERDFSTGILPAGLSTSSGPIQPASFLAETLQAELNSRGLAVKVSSEAADQSLQLQTFRMVNHRTSGFSPFITFTYLSADVDTPSGKKRVAAFVKRGKVPVWSFDEVIEPTLNEPLSLAVKELASKIAAKSYGWRASDKQLDALLAKLDKPKLEGPDYLDVYALGFSNHPRAIERVTQLSQHADEYVRLAAISSLGTLGANQQFNFLKGLYERREGSWQDRAMAIKAIGDLDTAESREFLAAQAKRWESAGSDKESLWTLQIIRLYL